METELGAFRRIISDFQASLAKPDALETQLRNLSLATTSNGSKWFDTCFVQLFKAVDALHGSLGAT
jgi:hypothetical protein